VVGLLASVVSRAQAPGDAVAPGPAPVGSVTLRVGVLREAGTIYEIAADGAAGQCTVVAQTLHCPAAGPVTFRWGPGGPWALVGDTVLAPGTEGTAVVWAAPRPDDEAKLAPGVVTPAILRDLFVRTSEHPIQPPSAALLDGLVALVDHPDPRVRRELPDALLPFWRHTASDPFPLESPVVLPAGLVTRLAADEDDVVRRRLASRLRDLQTPGEPPADEATAALLALSSEGGKVQRAAFASMAVRARAGEQPALATWFTALDRVTTPGPPGRAAANTLAALAKQLEPGPDVDPSLAVERTSIAQLERVWTVWKAWRAHVPFEPHLAERLLHETEGVSPELVKTWAARDPEGVASVVRRWEPRAPHSERYGIVVRALSESTDPALQALVADSLSPAEPPAPRE
jgi:hypothetical protein